MMPKRSDPHASRFQMKDIEKELSYKYQSQGKATIIFDRMQPKDSAASTEASEVIRRKDVERGKYNEKRLVYDPNYAYVSFRFKQDNML